MDSAKPRMLHTSLGPWWISLSFNPSLNTALSGPVNWGSNPAPLSPSSLIASLPSLTLQHSDIYGDFMTECPKGFHQTIREQLSSHRLGSCSLCLEEGWEVTLLHSNQASSIASQAATGSLKKASLKSLPYPRNLGAEYILH